MCIKEAFLGMHEVKVAPYEQLCLKKFLSASGAKYPLAHMVTHHFTLVTGASMADVNALFSGRIPTKIIIVLVRNDAFVEAWQK